MIRGYSAPGINKQFANESLYPDAWAVRVRDDPGMLYHQRAAADLSQRCFKEQTG